MGIFQSTAKEVIQQPEKIIRDISSNIQNIISKSEDTISGTIRDGITLVETTEGNLVSVIKDTETNVVSIIHEGRVLVQDVEANIFNAFNTLQTNLANIIQTAELGLYNVVGSTESDVANIVDDSIRNGLFTIRTLFEQGITTADDFGDKTIGTVFAVQNNIFSTIQFVFIILSIFWMVVLAKYGNRIFNLMELSVLQVSGVLQNSKFLEKVNLNLALI